MLKYVQKAWGREEWLVNNELYCLKRLIVNPGWQCSLHYHPSKDETFVCVSGWGHLTSHYGDLWTGVGEVHTLSDDARAYRVRPGTLHMFSSKAGMTLLEVSTHHDDDDVVRIENSKPIEGSNA